MILNQVKPNNRVFATFGKSGETISKVSLPEKVRDGFTLVEIIIVLVILTALLSFGFSVGFSSYKSYILNSQRDTLVSALRKARSDALENINNSSHGLYISTSSNSLTIFQGPSYSLRNGQYDQPIGISSLVAVNGLQEVVFSPLAATSSVSGTISLSNGDVGANISINYEGRIDW